MNPTHTDQKDRLLLAPTLLTLRRGDKVAGIIFEDYKIMKTATEWVMALLGSSAQKQPALQYSTTPSSQVVDSTLRLLAIAKDLPRSVTRQNEQLRLIKSIVGALVPLLHFDHASSLLACFEWDSFSAQSRQEEDICMFSNKIHGLWPEGDWSREEQVSSNPHWRVTRRVLNRCYNQSTNLTSRQIGICLMLLGSDQLAEVSQGEGHWQTVWSYLYLWFHSKLLGQEAGGSWSMHED